MCATTAPAADLAAHFPAFHERRSPRARSERGAALVEFALILPLLVLLVFGIAEFGLAYNAKMTLTHAAREAVRPLALGSGDPAAVARASIGSLDPAKLQITTQPAWPSACTPGDPTSVRLEYPWTLEIPLFPGSRTMTLIGQATMRCGG